MRPFPQSGSKNSLATGLGVSALLAVTMCECGCATVASTPTHPQPPTPQDISVVVTPQSDSVLLGNQLMFTAAVKNTSGTAVSWSVNSAAGGTTKAGTITSAGVYTAPIDLPAPANLQVTATSHADATKSGTATVTVQSDVAVTMASGAAAVELGATRTFQAVVSSGAHPDKTMLWRVSGSSFPFAPTPGTFSGSRPSVGRPDAPLGEDDRTGLRVLYRDAGDTVQVGSIRGRILNANPLSLPASPPGVTGVFGSHVAAVDAASGAVVAATIGGWSCSSPGPAQFDGTYTIERLPTGHNYQVYAEPRTARSIPRRSAMRLHHCAATRPAFRAGRRCKAAWCRR